MARAVLYYAHPGHQYSHANAAMWEQAGRVDGLARVDLYAEYPRFNIDIDAEQQRLLDHDVIIFQCPLFWYSTPSLVKEWIDLVLEHGFAYGEDGDKLSGKTILFAVTAAGDESAYTPRGYQHYHLRTFMTPLERTAKLCRMQFAAPYVLYGALQAPDEGLIIPHAEAYASLLRGLMDEEYDFHAAEALSVVEAKHIPQLIKG